MEKVVFSSSCAVIVKLYIYMQKLKKHSARIVVDSLRNLPVIQMTLVPTDWYN